MTETTSLVSPERANHKLQVKSKMERVQQFIINHV